MQIPKKKVSKEMIIETAVQLIDENGGISGVTLRDISKKLGCAHTNLYNYFGSLDEIYWEALGSVLLKLMNDSDTDERTGMDAEEQLFSTISNIIDFSLEHPGWYKLIWFETISGEPSPEVLQILQRPAESFASGLMKASKKELAREKANLISDILLRYLHGELCIWINHRSFIDNRAVMKENALSNVKLLYRLLIQEGESKL